MITLGAAEIAVGIASLIVVLRGTPTALSIVPWLFVTGLGVGAVQAQLTSIVLDGVPEPKSGQASALQSTFRQIGATFGVAVVGAVYATELRTRAESALSAVPSLTHAQATGIAEALAASGGTALDGASSGLPPAAHSGLVDVLTSSGRVALIPVLAVITLGLVVTRWLPRRGARGTAHEPPETEPGSLADELDAVAS